MRSRRAWSPIGLAFTIGLLGAAATPSTASAQTAFGYGLVGPLAVDNIGIRDGTTAWHVGGGGEILINRAVGLGAELGAISFPAVKKAIDCCHQTRSNAARVAILSVNGSYHFASASSAARPLQPFVTGGLTLVFDELALWNAGAGLDWWIARRAGLRVDVRSHLGTLPALSGFRFGVVFR